MHDDIATSLYVLGTAFAYCIPTFIALVRGHPNCVPIMIVNLTLGWTILGWAGTLAWSLTRRQRERES
jgi:ABC-type transport system involved in cytochrome c biogenesis permease component